MSIETLQSDLKEIIARAKPGPGPETRGADAAWSFITNDLLPWMETLTDEIGQMDEAVYAAVQGTEDVLHSDSAELIVGLIASGAVLIRELETRIGNDQRVLALIREYKTISKEVSSLVEEITIPDEPDEEPDEPEGKDAPQTEAQ